MKTYSTSPLFNKLLGTLLLSFLLWQDGHAPDAVGLDAEVVVLRTADDLEPATLSPEAAPAITTDPIRSA